MRRNPRPIPLDYRMVIQVSERILSHFESWLLSFQGTTCFDLNFAMWEYQQFGCYETYVKEGSGTILFVPIGISLTDVTGTHYQINEIGLNLVADIRYERLFYGATWTSGTTKKFKSLKTKFESRIIELQESIQQLKDLLAEFDLNNLEDDEVDDVAMVISNILEMEEKESRLSDQLKKVNIVQQDGGFISIDANIGESPRALLDNLSIPWIRQKALASLQEMLAHEMTHLRDPQTKKKGDYYNEPHEIRAEMQRIIFHLWRDLVWNKSISWTKDLKPKFSKESFDSVFMPYLDSKPVGYASFWDQYTEKNKSKIRSAIVQWLNENGFKLPKRSF